MVGEAAAARRLLPRHSRAAPATTSQMAVMYAKILGTGNVVAPSLKGLIGGIELTPDEVRDTISDCCDAIYVNADFHNRSAWRSNAAILGQFVVRRQSGSYPEREITG